MFVSSVFHSRFIKSCSLENLFYNVIWNRGSFFFFFKEKYSKKKKNREMSGFIQDIAKRICVSL